MGKKLDLGGKTFGRLLVLSECAERNQDGLVIWRCRCDCGKEVLVAGASLKKGGTKSCGCRRLDHLRALGGRKRTHGKSTEPIYQVWRSMVKRCHLPSASGYKNYGGRGIKVCEAWMDFQAFYADMGDAPTGLSIDRIDVNGDYEPSNCRWATQKQQSENRRNSRRVDVCGQQIPLREAAKQLGIPPHTLYWRVKRGISSEDITKRFLQRAPV